MRDDQMGDGHDGEAQGDFEDKLKEASTLYVGNL
jgi:hypothetical protein